MEVSNPPTCYEMEFQTVLTPKAMKFVAELVKEFNENVDQVNIIYVSYFFGIDIYSL